MDKFLSWTGKFALGVCLSLPMQTMANETDAYELEAPIQVSKTIAGLAVTQASINDVDRLMADMSMLKSNLDFMIFQETMNYDVYGQYCKSRNPELSDTINQTLNAWYDDIKSNLNSTIVNSAELNAPIDDAERQEMIPIMRNLMIMLYMHYEHSADPDTDCQALVENLNTLTDQIGKRIERKLMFYLENVKQQR